jgi:hypothetical protein
MPFPIPTMHITVEFEIATPAIVRLEYFGGSDDGKVVSTDQVWNFTALPTSLEQKFLVRLGAHGAEVLKGKEVPEYNLDFFRNSFPIPEKRLNPEKLTVPQPEPQALTRKPNL